MRLFMDSVVALLLVALLSGVMWHNKAARAVEHSRQAAQAEVRRFQQQIDLQTALATVQRNHRGYPQTIDPNWFQGALPNNPLLDVNHPWLEVASPDQKNLRHPPDREARTKLTAKFWYNPDTGIVRARVPDGISDAASLELYNFVNDCSVPELFGNRPTQR
jgi:hypothetical protein